MKKYLFILALFMGSSTLLAQDFDKAKQEITYLNNLSGAVNQVVASVDQTNFGPFAINGKCGYDSNWYCFGNCKTWTWWWKFPNFEWIKSSLKSRYQTVSTTADAFPQYFSPVKSWLLQSLPAFTATFKTEMDKINAAKGTPNERAVVIAAIETINRGLDDGSNQIRNGIQGISNFNQRMLGDLNQIESLKQQMESSIARNNQDVVDKTASYPCDRDAARSQAANIGNTVRNQFNTVLAKAINFDIASGRIDQSTSSLLGTLVTIQGNYQGVLTNLKNASISPAGAVQRLRLSVTFQAWQSLADFARQELG